MTLLPTDQSGPARGRIESREMVGLVRQARAHLRGKFVSELSVTLTEQCFDAHRERQWGAPILVCCNVVDIAFNVATQRMRDLMARVRPPSSVLVPLLLALVISTSIGYLNLHNDEILLPLSTLLLSTFMLGWLMPRHAWAWATIIALSVPVSSLLSLKIGVSYPCRPGHPYSCEPTTLSAALSTFVLVLPALVSAYTGVLLRRFATEG